MEPHVLPRTTMRASRVEGSDSPPFNDRRITRSPTVAIMASDPITQQGVVAYLRSRPQVEVLDCDHSAQADMVVILDTDVTSATLAGIRREAQKSANREMRIVLVANSITERQLTDMVGHRLVGFLPRRQTGMPQILAAVLDGWAGHALLPAALVRSLIEDLRVLQADEASPVGFTEREISIVRLLAEGWTTEEIADKLGYSERTIKNTLHSLNVRLGLRNRAHAVGYGARLGIL
ncbi:LuxR C-terminal-related transcriptional regulator [Streptomyces sp. NPDC052016]|jgi:DNA-binding NarL/FixJ family response regulator|uniref:helix-turn-helix transcriptional regulator n=1 Tax=Streptomyces sp. NPDC052016 TaxID=3365680 RepID=UPI0037CE01BC